MRVMSCLSHEQVESLRAKARNECRPSRRKLNADHHFRKPSDKPPFRQSSTQVAYWQRAEAFSRQKNWTDAANRLLPEVNWGHCWKADSAGRGFPESFWNDAGAALEGIDRRPPATARSRDRASGEADCCWLNVSSSSIAASD